MLVRPQLSYPGVYVQEVSGGPGPIAGVSTSVTAFIGRALRGPVEEPITVNSAGAFARHFGGLGYDFPMSYAVRDFFQAGGTQAVIVRLFSGDARAKVTVRQKAPWVDKVRDTFRDGVDRAFTDADGQLDNLEGEFRDLAAQFDERPLATGVATDVLKAVLAAIDAIDGGKIPTAGFAGLSEAATAAISAAITGETSDAIKTAVTAATLPISDDLKTRVSNAFAVTPPAPATQITQPMVDAARALVKDEADEVKAAFTVVLDALTVGTDTSATAATKIGAIDDSAAVDKAADAADTLKAQLDALDPQPEAKDLAAEARKLVGPLRTNILAAIAAPAETPFTAGEVVAFKAAIDGKKDAGVDAVVDAIRATPTAAVDVSEIAKTVSAAFGTDGTVDVTDAMKTKAAEAIADEPDFIKTAFAAAIDKLSIGTAAVGAVPAVPATTVSDAKAEIDKVAVDGPIPSERTKAAAAAVERGLDALEEPPTGDDLATAAKDALPDGFLALSERLFDLDAANAGAWANELQAWVDYDGIGPDSVARYAADGLKEKQLFNLHLALVDGRGRILEREDHNSVTTKAGTSRTLKLVLENESALARVPENTKDDPIGDRPPKTAGGWVDDDVEDSAKLKIKDYASLEAGKGFNAFDKADIINLMCVPPDERGGDTHTAVYAAAVSYVRKRRAFLIVDGPGQWDIDAKNGNVSKISPNDVKISGELARYAGVYFPRVNMADPEKGDTIHTFPVSGMIAGLYSRTDATRGVWKAPAGIQVGINGIESLTHKLTDAENGQLNPLGVNCLRTFPTLGTVVWGARTLAGADQKADEYKYVPVRRTALYIGESLYRGTQWAVFEPNDEPLWAQLRLQIGSFMNGLFRQGAFQGSAAKDAYSVRCDATTTTQTDIDLGIVNVVVSFAPLKPAEFVVIYIQQKAGANQ